VEPGRDHQAKQDGIKDVVHVKKQGPKKKKK
jgi:hypothetical protein